MMLVSDYDVVQGLERQLIIGFSIGFIIGSFAVAAILVSKLRGSDMKVSKAYFAALAGFAVFLALSRLVLLYHDYFAPDELDEPLWRLGSALLLVGLTILCFTIEKFMFTKTRKAITIVGVAIIAAYVIFEKAIATLLLYAGNVLLVILPFFIYIYIAKISTGSVRVQALVIIAGILVMLIGQFGANLLFILGVIDRLFSQIFGGVLAFLGLAILSYGFARTPGGG